MKVLIDLQGLQTSSAERGIGRYSSALTFALIAELKGHEIFILLNDSPQNTKGHSLIKEIQSKLDDVHIIRFPLAQVTSAALFLENDEVRLSKILRERYIEAVSPDVVLVTSLFEFDALSAIPKVSERTYFCAVILYDLIPLSDPEHYLGSPIMQNWYNDRLEQLKQADAVLAISEYVRQDALTKLNLPDNAIKNIAAGTNLDLKHHGDSEKMTLQKLSKFKPYLLYVGGFDKRKNTEKLIACFAMLPAKIRTKYKLLLAGGISDARRLELEHYAASKGLAKNEVVLYGYINDQFLVELYTNSHLFVFPSADEGFGLPPLEAMSLGVPTITSNCASLPEVVGNPKALFDPNNEHDFLEKLQLGLQNEDYRIELRARGLTQASQFSWEKSARIALEFIKERLAIVSVGKATRYLSFRDFLTRILAEQDFQLEKGENVKLTNLLARALYGAPQSQHAEEIMNQPAELRVTESLSRTIPDYSGITAPYVFSSMLCREQHFHLPLYTYWCRLLGESPRFHRKQWEFVYICQTLFERGYLRNGMSAIGFGVGKEPLVSYFASRGVQVLATDLDFLKAEELGWVSTDQHSDNLDALNEHGLCDSSEFYRLASFRNVDMNEIPQDIGSYDICWSSCAFEHLGSIRKGLDFVLNSARLLKPGGIAVHTTEYNISSNTKTLDNNPSFVIFRRCDIELLVKELTSEGYQVEPIDFSAGEDELERYVDLPPYVDEPHLRLQLAGEYVSTSLGIIIRAPGGEQK
ncbi:MAG TPA: glycosyltransferase [Methylotenera sp.]